MSWYRRWGVIGALAVAQVGAVVCYQAFLVGHASPARAAAQEKPAVNKADTPLPVPPVPPVTEPGKGSPATLPAIPDVMPLPVAKDSTKPADPLPPILMPLPPDNKTLPSAVVPAAAQEKVVPPSVDLPPLLPKPSGDAPPAVETPKAPVADALKAQVDK